MKKTPIVIRTLKDTNEVVEMSMKDSISYLKGFWKKDKIKQMLLSGQTLWTPYSEFTIKK